MTKILKEIFRRKLFSVNFKLPVYNFAKLNILGVDSYFGFPTAQVKSILLQFKSYIS